MIGVEPPPPVGNAPPTGSGESAPPAGKKSKWPEVLGWPELNGGVQDRYDRPEVTVYFFDVGDTRPPGYNPTRVVVFVDANLRVALTPLLG